MLCHPQKHNFEMHICGFDFDVVNMEDDSFFLEDRFSTFDRDLKNKKIMVPMNPEGGARTAPRAPRLLCFIKCSPRDDILFQEQSHSRNAF